MKLFVFLAAASLILAASGESHVFSRNLYAAVVQSNPSKNVVVSPASIYCALGLAYLGADGKTADELKGALEIEATSKDDIAKYYGNYLKKFEKRGFGEETKFSIANRVYMDKKYEINPKFDELATSYFHSTAEPVNFEESTLTAEKINSWVSEHTNNKIKDIISSGSLEQSTSAVLVNAIYFKGHWEHRFNVEKTERKDFHLTKSEKKPVDMMFQQNYFNYADWDDLDATAIHLPYVNTDIYMLIILPKKVDGLKDVMQKFQTAEIQTLISKFSEKKVNVHMPKFKFEFETSLNDALAKMGIKDMFSGSASFGSLLKDTKSLHVSDVKHKAFVEVDEIGTEASAATSIIMTVSAPLHTKDAIVYDFNVDRPFMFAIKDRDTVYFAGQVTNI